jgi:hypothetical protein
MIQVFFALTALRPFPFNRQHNFSGGTAIGVASSETPYPGCSANEDSPSQSEEPPGSRTGADSEPIGSDCDAQPLPAYQLDPIERALQYGWFKKAVTIVVVAAAFRSAARARTVCDLLDDVVLPFARVLYRKWRDDGGFFAAKAQAGYTEMSSGDLSAQAASVQAPEPETLASGIDLEQLTIIPVGENLDLESLAPYVSDLLEITAQPAGDVDNTGAPGEAAGTEVATMLTHDVAAVLDLAAQLAHAAHQSTL